MTETTVEFLEPRIERVLRRFHVPAEDAQEILDEIMLTMLTKRDRIRDPQRWVIRTLKNRCLMYWRERRRRLYRVVDSGLLTVLGSHDVSAEEKDVLRDELRLLVEKVEPGCRERLERRYGLDEEHDGWNVEPWKAGPEEEKTLPCVGALVRRFTTAGSRRRMEELNLLWE